MQFIGNIASVLIFVVDVGIFMDLIFQNYSVIEKAPDECPNTEPGKGLRRTQ